jgi:hypothetical protein
MTPACAQLAQPAWVDEDSTALGLAPDASVLGATWLADQRSFWLPREATQFSCVSGPPDVDMFIGTLEASASSSMQTRWESYATASMLATLVVGPSMTPSSRTGFFIASANTELACLPYSSGVVVELTPAASVREPLVEVTVVEEAHESAEGAAPTPLEIVLELKDSLDLTWDDAEGATGIDRNTFLNWQRTGAVPRPSTVRKLMRVYGLVSALESALGKDKSSTWLHGGAPSWIDVLKSGDLSTFASAVTAVVDDNESTPSAFFAYRPGPEEEEDVPLPPRRQFKKSGRPATRSRLHRGHD